MNHQAYLLYALQVAREFQGQCAPNPAVGAVIVNNGEILSRAAHHGAGTAHAERAVIDNCQSIPDGSKMYVTLEPCCHWGRTPPCTDAIVDAGIKEVYFSFLDPNPQVCGQGMTSLLHAGVNCQQIVIPEITEFYHDYAYWVSTKLPWVRAKLALSLDGKIANKDGSPIKLTDSTVDQFTHQKRYESDAILTTVQTLLADNPQMNARLYGNQYAKTIYVLDSKCRMTTDLQIFQTAKRIVLFHGEEVHQDSILNLEGAGVECIAIPEQSDGSLPMEAIIKKIGELGTHSLWVEAGGKCFQSLIRRNLIKTAYLYYSPKIIGSEALPAFTDRFDITSSPKWQQMGLDSVCEINFDD